MLASLACAHQLDDDITTETDRRTRIGAGGSANSPSTSDDSLGGASVQPATVVGSNCVDDCGPDYEHFFDNSRLATIRINIDAGDLAAQRSGTWLDLLWSRWTHCKPYDSVRVSFEYDSPDDMGDVTLTDVAMRLRGSMDRGVNALQGFKLDFQYPYFAETGHSGTRRRFAGINRLNTLSLEPCYTTNTPSDVTHMIQCLSYKYLRDFDIPAPRCNHLRVYIQGRYYGLMENVEEADHGRFLLHHFGTSDGLLVEASPSGCGFEDSQADLAYHGPLFGNYASPARYNLERGTQADAEASLFPMFQCGDATQTPDDQAFASCIQEWLDLDEWLRLIAAESVMPELESLGFDRNFYLYFRPDAGAPHGGRFVVYPWDLDTAFLYQGCSPADCDLFGAVSARFTGTRLPLIQRLTRVFKAQYCARLNDFTTNVFDPVVVEMMGSEIWDGMADDPTHTQTQWKNEVVRLRDYVQSHRQSVVAMIASACSTI